MTLTDTSSNDLAENPELPLEDHIAWKNEYSRAVQPSPSPSPTATDNAIHAGMDLFWHFMERYRSTTAR